MRVFIAGAFGLLLAGCNQAAQTMPGEFPPPPPPQLSNLSKEPGTRALQVHAYCQNVAYTQCSRPSVYCESYRKNYLQSCMIGEGVSPDFVFLLAR